MHCVHSLYVRFLAKASYAQQRIFLDEHIRFSSTDTNQHHHNIYAIPSLYRLPSLHDQHHRLSMSRFYRAYQTVIHKHNILRTALYLDDASGSVVQECFHASVTAVDRTMQSYGFTVVDDQHQHHHRGDIVKDILKQTDLFDLSRGHVINCHILRHGDCTRDDDDDVLDEDDWILFTFHHAAFDGASTSIFLRDLSRAYDLNEKCLSFDDNRLQYTDYAVHEHCMDMASSGRFWCDHLQGYDVHKRLSLPFDRYRHSSADDQRSGLALTHTVTFDDDLCAVFVHYASSHHVTLFQLALATFYVFLFRLTHGQSDLCLSSIHANRYRNELVDMIGMFVSTLPYRVQIDADWSLDELVEDVQAKCLSVLEHAHYPLQEILSHLHANQSNVAFLETMFDFVTLSKDAIGHCSINGAHLERVPMKEVEDVTTKFDFGLRFLYDPSSNEKQLSCSFVCSRDLFGETSVPSLGQRYRYLIEQLFRSKSSNNRMDTMNKIWMKQLTLVLPEEDQEIQSVIFHRLDSSVDEGKRSCVYYGFRSMRQIFIRNILTTTQKSSQWIP